jgi:predicted amino acid-binding ACT domain protein
VAEELDLFIAVRPVPPDVEPFVSQSTLTVSVHGPDCLGIVARISRDVAMAGADIFELVTRLIDGEYVLRLTAALASGSVPAELEETLRRAAEELGVGCDISSSPSAVVH